MCLGPFGRFGGTLFLERPPYFVAHRSSGLQRASRADAVRDGGRADAGYCGGGRLCPLYHATARAGSRRLFSSRLSRMPGRGRSRSSDFHSPIVCQTPRRMPRSSSFRRRQRCRRRRRRWSAASRTGARWSTDTAVTSPPPYEVLRVAFQEGDASVIQALPTTAPVCAVIDRRTTRSTSCPAVEERRGRHVGADGPFEFYLFDHAPLPLATTARSRGASPRSSESAQAVGQSAVRWQARHGLDDAGTATGQGAVCDSAGGIPLESPASS